MRVTASMVADLFHFFLCSFFFSRWQESYWAGFFFLWFLIVTRILIKESRRKWP